MDPGSTMRTQNFTTCSIRYLSDLPSRLQRVCSINYAKKHFAINLKSGNHGWINFELTTCAQINSFTMNPMLGPLVGVDHLKYLPIMRGYYKEIESQMNAFKAFLLEYVENESANASGYIQLFEEGSGKPCPKTFAEYFSHCKM